MKNLEMAAKALLAHLLMTVYEIPLDRDLAVVVSETEGTFISAVDTRKMISANQKAVKLFRAWEAL
jgi:hypothetical protein